MNIRKYRENDRASLIALWKEVFPDDPPHNEPDSVLDAKIMIDDLIFVAEDDNELVAGCMAGYDGHRGWLYAVAVSPARRREGLGKDIVNHVLNALSEIGCIKVNLQIRSTNTQVAAFYRSIGFTVEERLSMGKFIGKDTSRLK